MKQFARILSIAFSIVFIAACQSSLGTNDQKTNFRVVNAVPDVDSLDFFLDAKSFLSNVGYLESSDYSDEESGSHKISVSVSGSFTPLVDTSVGFSDTSDYTLFVFGPSTKSASILSNDDNTPTGEDTTKLRVINAASANKTLDIYVVPSSQSIDVVVPTVKSLGYKSISSYVSSAKGTYSVIVARKGTKEILSTKGSVKFNGDSVYTVLVSDSAEAGDLPKIVILKDHES